MAAALRTQTRRVEQPCEGLGAVGEKRGGPGDAGLERRRAAGQLAATAPRVFDADLYRIARRVLPTADALAVVELAG